MTDEISEVVSSFRPNLNLIVGDEDLGGVCPDGQHGQNRQRDERTQPCRHDFPRGGQLEGARNSIKLKPHCSTGDKEDQPTVGWVWRCWRLSPACRPPPPAWIQGCQLFQQRLLSEKNINIILINTNIGTKNNHLFQLGYKVTTNLSRKTGLQAQHQHHTDQQHLSSKI